MLVMKAKLPPLLVSLFASKALSSELCLGTYILLCLERVTLRLQTPLSAAQVGIWAIKLTIAIRSVVHIPCKQLRDSVKFL